MSAEDAMPVVTALGTEPEFELECLYDDPSNPSELTVFTPETERLATEWVTVDQSTAVSLEEVR
ncbi:hypothetical protein SAMN04488065_2799 [Haloplanus vescus]|uniref:Uncharacterized protein n=1 Tax=Haloplanus vescus TaxID=555874 RepID=A0A1H4AIS1_9EURY|nr:hypothetical protein [Haloplanus vescus]SEA35651.1 hypothetical protein SAMN04488065_2799 [Haloplanus vescus]